MIKALLAITDDLWCIYIVNTLTGVRILYHESDDYFETKNIYDDVIKTLKIRD